MLWRLRGTGAVLVFWDGCDHLFRRNGRFLGHADHRTVVGAGQEPTNRLSRLRGTGPAPLGLQSMDLVCGLRGRAVDLEPDDLAVVVGIGTPSAGELIDEVQSSPAGALGVGHPAFGQRRSRCRAPPHGRRLPSRAPPAAGALEAWTTALVTSSLTSSSTSDTSACPWVSSRLRMNLRARGTTSSRPAGRRDIPSRASSVNAAAIRISVINCCGATRFSTYPTAPRCASLAARRRCGRFDRMTTVAVRCGRAQIGKDLESRTAGHGQIEQDHVRSVLRRCCDGLVGTRRLDHVDDPVLGQQASHQHPLIGVVVDHHRSQLRQAVARSATVMVRPAA